MMIWNGIRLATRNSKAPIPTILLFDYPLFRKSRDRRTASIKKEEGVSIIGHPLSQWTRVLIDTKITSEYCPLHSQPY